MKLTWRTLSACRVETRLDVSPLSRAKRHRQEWRCGTQECVRHMLQVVT
jgi:hypothetical protein